MTTNLTTIKQNSKVALAKSKNLLNITNEILSDKNNKKLIKPFENFKFLLTLQEYKNVEIEFNEINFSSSEQYIILFKKSPYTFLLWDVVSCRGVKMLNASRIPIFSHDENYLLSTDGSSINLYDIKSKKDIKKFECHNNDINSIAISNDNKYIVSGHEKGNIKLWDTKSAKVIKVFEGHNGWVNSVAISENNKYIASADDSIDEIIKIWDTTTNECLQIIKELTSENLTFLDNDKLMISGIYKEIVIFNLQTRTIINSYKKNILPVDTYNIIVNDGEIIVSNKHTKKEIIIYSSNFLNKYPDLVLFSLDRKYLILVVSYGLFNEGIEIINVDTKELIKEFTVNNLLDINISQNSKYLLYTERKHNSWSHEVAITTLYDLINNETIQSFKCESIAKFTKDSKYIIYIDDNYIFKFWDISTKKDKYSYLYFKDKQWISWNSAQEYNCSDGAHKYFCFVDDSKDTPEVLDINHPVYKANKKDKLL